jgi:mannose-6-phosphate isomerase-like protein (cupin superfamily)
MSETRGPNRVKHLNVEKEGEFMPFHTDRHPGYAIHPLLEGMGSSFLCQINRIEPGMKKVHSHEGENFLVILEGEGEYYIEDNKAVPVKAGDFCHALSFEVHGIKCTGSKPIKYLAIEEGRTHQKK